MSNIDDTKAKHKVSAAAANDTDVYDDTAFGRRRVRKIPKALLMLFHMIAIPNWPIFQRQRHSRKA